MASGGRSVPLPQAQRVGICLGMKTPVSKLRQLLICTGEFKEIESLGISQKLCQKR